MAEDSPHIERSPDKLVFASGEPIFNSMGSFWLLALAAILVIAIYASAASTSNRRAALEDIAAVVRPVEKDDP
jgi:hypothetical protein